MQLEKVKQETKVSCFTFSMEDASDHLLILSKLRIRSDAASEQPGRADPKSKISKIENQIQISNFKFRFQI